MVILFITPLVILLFITPLVVILLFTTPLAMLLFIFTPLVVMVQWIPFVQQRVINFPGIEISDSEEIVETATVTSQLLREKVVGENQWSFF